MITNEGNQTLWRLENEQHSDWMYAQVSSILPSTLYHLHHTDDTDTLYDTSHAKKIILYTFCRTYTTNVNIKASSAYRAIQQIPCTNQLRHKTFRAADTATCVTRYTEKILCAAFLVYLFCRN